MANKKKPQITIKATYEVDEFDRFIVKLTGFAWKAISMFKTITDCNYHAESKTWSFPIEEKQKITDELKAIDIEVTDDITNDSV